MTALTINIFSVADIENNDELFSIVNRVNYPIIPNSYSIVAGIKKFFVAKRAGVLVQRKDFVHNLVLKLSRIFVENLFRASGYFNVVNIYRPRFDLISNARLLNERVFSCLRRSAIAKSMISSCISLFLSSFDKKDSCCACGKLVKAVKNTSAIASVGVTLAHRPYYNVSLSVGAVACQGNEQITHNIVQS